jgi:hypothetical protein
LCSKSFTGDHPENQEGVVCHSDRKSPTRSRGDLVRLLAAVNEELLIELGKPLPQRGHLAKARAARCPACHNRALLDRSEE